MFRDGSIGVDLARDEGGLVGGGDGKQAMHDIGVGIADMGDGHAPDLAQIEARSHRLDSDSAEVVHKLDIAQRRRRCWTAGRACALAERQQFLQLDQVSMPYEICLVDGVSGRICLQDSSSTSHNGGRWPRTPRGKTAGDVTPSAVEAGRVHFVTLSGLDRSDFYCVVRGMWVSKRTYFDFLLLAIGTAIARLCMAPVFDHGENGRHLLPGGKCVRVLVMRGL